MNTVTIIANQPPIPLERPLETAPPSTRAEVIKHIALHTLAELALSLVMGFAVCLFVATALEVTLVLDAILAQTVINLAVRILGSLVAKESKVAKICTWIAPLNFADNSATNFHTLIHESGHALAGKTVYAGADPEISIYPFRGGGTRFYIDKLTAIGEKLGASRSIAFVTAAGPLASLALSGVALATAVVIRDDHPTLSKYLSVASINDYISHAAYALSALDTDPMHVSHDFVRLRQYGLHPVAAATAILATPILIALAAKRFSTQ